MEETLITFETAKLAKDKGFNIPVVNFYKKSKKPYTTTGSEYQSERDAISDWNNGQGSYPTSPEDVECSAPTQSLLQKWLRELHNIDVFVGRDGIFKKDNYCIVIYNDIKYISRLRPLNNDVFSGYSTYEEALEIGLQEALKLVK